VLAHNPSEPFDGRRLKERGEWKLDLENLPDLGK